MRRAGWPYARLEQDDGLFFPVIEVQARYHSPARYDDEPLLIGGKGAGVEMTAAGVVGDMIGLAREMWR